MKLRPNQNSTRPRIFENGDYEHPWYQHNQRLDNNQLNKPNPPSKEAIEKAKFVDKTYEWDRSSNIRPRDKRSSK